jgi:hypothetical protein
MFKSDEEFFQSKAETRNRSFCADSVPVGYTPCSYVLVTKHRFFSVYLVEHPHDNADL